MKFDMDKSGNCKCVMESLQKTENTVCRYISFANHTKSDRINLQLGRDDLGSQRDWVKWPLACCLAFSTRQLPAPGIGMGLKKLRIGETVQVTET